MATVSVNASISTLYLAGGSGNNYIPDGYIKTVEKVWIDNYTFAMTGTNTTIAIAVLPPNKKLTSVECVINSSISQSSGTIGIGWSTDADGASWGNIMAEATITHNLTTTTLSAFGGGFIGGSGIPANGVAKITAFQNVVSGTQNTVAIKLNNWTMSTGSLRTIVRYT